MEVSTGKEKDTPTP